MSVTTRLIAVLTLSLATTACDDDGPAPRTLSDLSRAEAAALCADLDERGGPERAAFACGLQAVLSSADPAACEARRADCAPPASGACAFDDEEAGAACDATIDELVACYDAATEAMAAINARLGCGLAGDPAALQAVLAEAPSLEALPACAGLLDRCPLLAAEPDEAPAEEAPASWSLVIEDTSAEGVRGVDLCGLQVTCATGAPRARGYGFSGLRTGEALGWGDEDESPVSQDISRTDALLAGEGDCAAGRYLPLRPGGSLDVRFMGGEACEVAVDAAGEGARYRVLVCAGDDCSAVGAVDPAAAATFSVR